MESQQIQVFQEQRPGKYNFDDIDAYFSLQSMKEDDKFDVFKQTRPTQEVKQQKGASWFNLLNVNSSKKIECDSEGQQTDSQKINDQGLFEQKSCRAKMFIQVGQATKQRYINAVKGNKQETSDLNINYKTITKSLLRQEFLFNDFNQNQEDVIRNFQAAKANFKSFQQLFGLQQQNQDNGAIFPEESDNNQLDNSFFQRKERRTQTEISSKRDPQSSVDVVRKSKKNLTQSVTQQYIIGRKCDRIRKLCLKNFTSCKIISQTLKSAKMSSRNKIITLKFIQQLRDGVISPENFHSWKRKISAKKPHFKSMKNVTVYQQNFQLEKQVRFKLNEQ